VLALKEKFGSLEKDFLSEFKVVFEPLPHVNKLPQNVMARIKLKNAEQTIKTRTYSCPQKFHEAWQTLIQQHLDAGRIPHVHNPEVRSHGAAMLGQQLPSAEQKHNNGLSSPPEERRHLERLCQGEDLGHN
jgi:hypothetical protein